MEDQQTIDSILTADIGSTFTHACLIDRIDGLYRLVAAAEAPSTLGDSESDITIGLRRAIRRLEFIAQRALLDESDELIRPQQESGIGVDALVVTSNAAPPLQCVIIGVTDDISVASAQRACASANVFVTQTLSLGTRLRRWDADSLAHLQQVPPQIVLLVGGLDTGPVTPLRNTAEVLDRLYRDIEMDARPVIIFAGNQEARRSVADILSPRFDLRVVENVRPSMAVETASELQRELADVYEKVRLAALPGFRRLRAWCTAPVFSTTQGLSVTWRYIARHNNLSQGLLGVDIGGATTYIGAARGDLYQWAVGAELGTSYGIQRVLALSQPSQIRQWLPIGLRPHEMLHRLENAWLRPASVPQSMDDLLLTHAVARRAIALTMQSMHEQYWHGEHSPMGERIAPAFDLLAVRGGALAHTPQDGMAVLTLLDALQPIGLSRIVLDGPSFWPQLGALAGLVPLAAAQVLERDGVRELGTVLAPLGQAPEGEMALRVKLIDSNGQMTRAEVPAGTVQCFPLEAGEEVTVEVRPHHLLDLGLGHKGVGGKAQVRGGGLGLVIDTRGRPLVLPEDEGTCQLKTQEWLRNLGCDVHRPS